MTSGRFAVGPRASDDWKGSRLDGAVTEWTPLTHCILGECLERKERVLRDGRVGESVRKNEMENRPSESDNGKKKKD